MASLPKTLYNSHLNDFVQIQRQYTLNFRLRVHEIATTDLPHAFDPPSMPSSYGYADDVGAAASTLNDTSRPI